MFHVKEVEFLGYMVAVDGVTMSERKVQSKKDWKHPRSVQEVQIFIGFANFYRRFIKDFSKICKPITETLEGDPRNFSWVTEQNQAFQELKTRFIAAPILCHFFPDAKPFWRQMLAILHLGVSCPNSRIRGYTQWRSIHEN